MLKKLGITILLVLIILVGIQVANQYITEKKVIIKTNDRQFKLGISGYVPVNFPNSSFIDIKKYWSDIESHSEIYGIHVNWNEHKTAVNLSKNVNSPVYVLFGYQSPDEWVSTEGIIQSIDYVLNKNKNIQYVGVGNEINLLKLKYPKQFNDFVESLKIISKHVESHYPEVKLFTTFQYDSLIGDAKLMGKQIDNKKDIQLVEQFTQYTDLIGYTVYPFLNYTSVEKIPSSYFTNLQKITNSPFFISETSWPTQNNIVQLKDQGFEFNEDEQAQYLELLKSNVEGMNNLFSVNIVYFNDYIDWVKNGNSKNPLFDSLGIRNNNGEPKKGYDVWKNWITN